MDYGLTIEERERLTLLATYLDKLPADYQDFNMGHFFLGKTCDGSGELARQYALHNGGVASCGTAACAIGHGPSAGILVPESLITQKSRLDSFEWEIDWWGYSLLFTGLLEHRALLFDWMFGEGWRWADNHHYSAAARIKYVLAGEVIPDKLNQYHGMVGARDLYAKYNQLEAMSETSDGL